MFSVVSNNGSLVAPLIFNDTARNVVVQGDLISEYEISFKVNCLVVLGKIDARKGLSIETEHSLIILGTVAAKILSISTKKDLFNLGVLVCEIAHVNIACTFFNHDIFMILGKIDDGKNLLNEAEKTCVKDCGQAFVRKFSIITKNDLSNSGTLFCEITHADIGPTLPNVSPKEVLSKEKLEKISAIGIGCRRLESGGLGIIFNVTALNS